MSTPNLWGDIPQLTERKHTALSMLREQAEILSRATQGVLIGEVTNENKDDQLGGILRIVAPVLGGYSVPIIQVSHSIYGYPVLLTNLLTKQDYTCSQPAGYENTLRQVLSSKEVHEAIAALLAQSAS
jgi:hypothetical protein